MRTNRTKPQPRACFAVINVTLNFCIILRNLERARDGCPIRAPGKTQNHDALRATRLKRDLMGIPRANTMIRATR